MSMKNFTAIATIFLLTCCSFCSCASKERDTETEQTEDVNVVASLDRVDFSPLPAYEWSAEDSTESEPLDLANELVRIYDVYRTPNLFRVYLTIANVDQSFTQLSLRFKVGNRIERTIIKDVFPNTSYEVLFKRHSEDSFSLVDADWNSKEEPRLSDEKEFGGLVKLKGANTLKYFGLGKDILIFDSRGCVINELELVGFGTKIINQGAAYYKVVNR